MPNKELLIKITDPSGKSYEIFTDGSFSGFPDGSVIFNRSHALEVLAKLPKELRESYLAGSIQAIENTPRTELNWFEVNRDAPLSNQVVDVEFARQLERELNQANAELNWRRGEN